MKFELEGLNNVDEKMMDELIVQANHRRIQMLEEQHEQDSKNVAAMAMVALEIAAEQARREAELKNQGKKNVEEDEDEILDITSALHDARLHIDGMIADRKPVVDKAKKMMLASDNKTRMDAPYILSSSEKEQMQVETCNDAIGGDDSSLSRNELLAKSEQLVKEGMLEDALYSYDAALTLGEDPTTLYKRAVLHIGFHNYEEAERDLSQCLKLRPGYTEALLERGCIRIKQLEYEGACDDLEDVLTAWPDHERAFSEYRRAVRFHGKPRNGPCTRKPAAANANTKKAQAETSNRKSNNEADEFLIEREFWSKVTEEKIARHHQ